MNQGEQDRLSPRARSGSPALGPTPRDSDTELLRALIGMTPVAGPALAWLVGEVIPNQRLERLEAFARHLAERLEKTEAVRSRERLRESENVALIEEGASQAVRAFSEERQRQLAELVAGGVSDERREYLESRRLLRLLGELDDAEVIVLAFHLEKNSEEEYWERHASVLQPPDWDLGSNQQEIDLAAIREAGKQHLLRLGLLEQRAMDRSTFVQLTPLGRLLLRRVGLADENDF